MPGVPDAYSKSRRYDGEDLKELIRQVVKEQLQNQLPPKDTRSVAEILQSIEQHRWTPPPGTPTASQIIRENRDR
ncbi:MAG: hypothetical protein H7Z11_23810 [Verrucomicrobia bacterium]|nr:hypothetical protein [Leptolyngbya sp. ES-bin-22]